MTVPRRSKPNWEEYKHRLFSRYVGDFHSHQYDKNVRYVLEDIAIQLGRIADALEGNTND